MNSMLSLMQLQRLFLAKELLSLALGCLWAGASSRGDLLSKNKAISLAEYPSEIEHIIGKEFLFRLEQKDYALFNFEDSYRVNRVCSDPDIIVDYKAGMEFETPLKCNSAVTEIEVSPIACMSSPSMVDDSGSAFKRELEQPVDGVLKRKKRGKVKGVKVERSWPT
ncbi:hypothetical protein SESBI_02831 [Sesbania bispinosa]|nr:hypothetical protein SESBI_02831 [Sesbania bispinosa]